MASNNQTQTMRELPPEVLALMRERLLVVNSSVKAMEVTPHVRILLNLRHRLEAEASYIIAALDKQGAAQLSQSETEGLKNV